MSLTLHIENFLNLDDGGPVSVEVPEAGLSVGRAAGMGWILPDVSRHISGHHFDVVFDGKEWWLHDRSTNGTFLQGQRYRLDGPHRLSHGDRLQVGQYIIVALMDLAAGAEPMSPASLPEFGAAGGFTVDEDPWSLGGGPREPVNPLPAYDVRHEADFGQEYISMPTASSGTPSPAWPPGDPRQPGGDQGRGGQRPVTPPPHTPPPHTPPPRTPPPARADTGADFVRAFCQGAGLPPEMFHAVPADALAHDLGAAIRHVAREVMFSLQDRAAAKQFALAGDRTMRSATDNNPLKFLPDPEQAIEAMFLRPRAGFQTGPDGLDDALKDLRLHQAAVFAALQPALGQLLGDLAPEHILAAVEGPGNRGGGGRRARAWDMYLRNWDAKSAGHDNGVLDEFLDHFSTAYRDVIRRAVEGSMPAEAIMEGAAAPEKPAMPEPEKPSTNRPVPVHIVSNRDDQSANKAPETATPPAGNTDPPKDKAENNGDTSPDDEKSQDRIK